MCFKWHEKSKLSRQTRCSLAALNQIYSCFVLLWLCPSPFSICSTIRRATTVSQCIVLTNHKSHFGAYSGPEPVFLLHWPFCLRAGDLSRLNHPVTFPPTAQHISMGKEYDFSCSAPPPPHLQLLSDLFLLFFSIPSHLLDLFAERRPGPSEEGGVSRPFRWIDKPHF